MASVPIFLNGKDQHILIVGITDAALAKLVLMLETGSLVTVVGTGATAALKTAGIKNSKSLNVRDRAFAEEDIKGKTLVYIASDFVTQERARRIAVDHGLPVNVIDQPGKSTFITPAQFRRGSIEIALSSGGAAPVFVRRLRALLEKIVSPTIGLMATAAGKTRGAVKSEIKDMSGRRLFWDRIFDNSASYDGLSEEEIIAKIIKSAKNGDQNETGLVQLVGAGPGDPDLLTIKAHRALQEADVILYDRLVSDDVLALARRDASRIYVGKREGEHGVGQENIHALMIEHAKKGLRVVRLKSGDPLMFARAGEELVALSDANIPCEVIPGITALSASAARAQIPLTDREYATSLTLVTGHTKHGGYNEFARLAGKGRTLAVYMGIKTAPELVKGLISEGVAPTTPVAVIENATRKNERRLYSTLQDLDTLIAEENVKSPALILIGDTISQCRDWIAHEDNKACRGSHNNTKSIIKTGTAVS